MSAAAASCRRWILAGALVSMGIAPAPAQPPGPAPAQLEDRRHLLEAAALERTRMMQVLGITEPGPFPSQADDPGRPPNTSPVPDVPNRWTDGMPGHTIVRSAWGRWTNYDLAKADCGPLPDPLRLGNGEPVRDAATWWRRRRPEILDDFQSEIYGRIPRETPAVRWALMATDRQALGGTAVLEQLTGLIDNSRHRAASPELRLTLYLPAKATGPVPVVLIITGNQGPTAPPAVELVLAQGWGCAVFDPNALQADSGAGLNSGIIGLVNAGRPRRPDDWGSLAAIAWGLSRVIDYFETIPAIDARRLGVQGISRWGKAALVAAAYEPRWAVTFASCSGEGGAKLHRRDFGEQVDNLCGPSLYHWMAGNFLKYAGNWAKLPVDQHELLALIAPRPVFISAGTTDAWSDPVGQFKACVAAGPVYRLLGEEDLGQSTMPAPDSGLIAGAIGFRLHAGGHSDLPDWPTFLRFAARHFARVSPSSTP